MGLELNAFRLLLWKNLVSEVHAWPWFLLEVVLLFLSSIMIVISPSLFGEKVNADVTGTTNYVMNISSIDKLYNESAFTRKKNEHFTCLYYVPKNNFTSALMNATGFKLNLPITVGFDNEELMDTSFTGNTCLAAVRFYGVKKDSDVVPNVLQYALRFPGDLRTVKVHGHQTAEHFWITRCHGDVNTDTFYPQDCIYLREGFLQLQHRIFLEWLHLRNVSDSSIPDLTLNVMSPNDDGDKICYFDTVVHFDWFWYQWFFFMPIIIMISRFCREINDQVLATHSTYKLSNIHHWLAHYVVCLGHLAILNTVLFFLFGFEWSKDYQFMFLRLPPKFYIIGFLLLNSSRMILFSMTLSILFRNSVNAILFYVSTWICSFTILATGLNALIPMSWSIGIYLLLFSNNVLAYSIKLLEKWNDITKRNFCILIIILVLFNTIMTAFVVVGNWIFLFKYREHSAVNSRSPLRVWIQRRRNHLLQIAYAMQYANWQNLEFTSYNTTTAMIIMRNVYVFQRNKNWYPLLKEVTLRFYYGEISIILGPINSGKDLMIRVLAGWQNYIGSVTCSFNKNFYKDPGEYVHLIDVSINGPSIFEHLTVAQNLRYFIEMKMISSENPQEHNHDDVNRPYTMEGPELTEVSVNKESIEKKRKHNHHSSYNQGDKKKNFIQIEVNKWLKYLQTAKISGTSIVSKLSRDQCQLVHLCCILSNNTPIVLLNRPTDCMNPTYQQIYWNILQQEKISRIIVMTTLCVDEANIIGDRITILNNGAILAWGSPLFLRTHFSRYYKLTILVDTLEFTENITDFLRASISTITKTKSTDEFMLSYKVPKNKRKLYPEMLMLLQVHHAEWGIRKVTLLSDDLKDIYMNLTMDHVAKRNITPIANVLHFIHDNNWKKNRNNLFPVLYKKTINLGELHIPVYTILFVIAVVLILYELTKRLHPVSSTDKGMIFGLQLEGETRKSIQDEWDKECSFIELNEVNVADAVTIKKNEPIFYTYKTFNCFHDISYMEYLESDLSIKTKLGAIELLNPNNFHVWINERVYHTAALMVNMAENLILSKLDPNNTATYVVTVNKPMTVPLATRVNLIEYQVYFLRLPVTIGITMPFTLATFIIRRVQERNNHFYTVQKISGLSMNLFWILTFIWDLLTYFVYSVIFLVVMMFTTVENFGITPKLMTLFLLNLHAVPVLLSIYILSFYLSGNSIKAFLLAAISQLYSGIYLFILYWDFLKVTKINYLLMLSPTFALLEAVGNIYIAAKERRECELRCDNFPGCEYENICSTFPKCCFETFLQWQPPGVLSSLIYLCISVVIWLLGFILMLRFRARKFKKQSKKVNTLASGYFVYEDEEVIKQKIIVSDMKPVQAVKYNVVVDQLGVNIPNPRTSKIIETVSFAVKRGRCLGVYGVKSGKTNLLMCLVGRNRYGFGDVYLNGWNLKQRMQMAYSILGFASLKTSFSGAFTLRQLFKYIFKLRGVPEKKIAEWVRELSVSFHLQPFLTHKIERLPSGVQHRVKIALALIARNCVYIFDDLTRGLPPYEQRLIWNAICYLRDAGFTVIFTTNYSYECEELADEMIMLKDNKIIAIGKPHVLRSKYTTGINLDVKLRIIGDTNHEIYDNLRKDIDNFHRFVVYIHKHSELIRANGHNLHYYIPLVNIDYAQLFATLERNQIRLHVMDYTISMATLRSAYGNIYEALERKEQYSKPEE